MFSQLITGVKRVPRKIILSFSIAASIIAGMGALTLIDLTSQVKNVLPHGNGGTDVSSPGSSGNVLLSNGTNWISGSISGGSIGGFAGPEVPSGSINGSNQTFTLAHTPTSGLEIFFNGQLWYAGGNDFSITGATITTIGTPQTGDRLVAYYRY